LFVSAIKTSRSAIGFKFELKTHVSEIHDASFNSVNVKPATEFQDGLRAAKQNTDIYVKFKVADSSRRFFYFYLL